MTIIKAIYNGRRLLVLALKGKEGKQFLSTETVIKVSAVSMYLEISWTPGPRKVLDKLWQVSGRSWGHATSNWEIMEAETVDKHTGNYSVTKHTSHIINPNHSKWKYTLIPYQPHLPSATTNCCFHTPGPADWADLTDWASFKKHVGICPGSLLRLHAASHFALPYYHNKHLQ